MKVMTLTYKFDGFYRMQPITMTPTYPISAWLI